jgi:glycosyltransferase involved in cell wall biosynthesis
MAFRYTFTVFTPTLNRAHTLSRVYESLKSQTFQDFEWLIVDDGSSDGTGELVEEWQQQAAFPIRYIWQENGGKHRARNRGVREARGEFFFTWDSDDESIPDALERMKACWDDIPAEKHPFFAGVTGLCVMKDSGAVVGSRFPRDIFDSDMFAIREKYRITGEKCGFQRTEVMREFPFPEIAGERFITESVVWYRIARKYKTRFFNQILRIYDQQPNGLSAAGIRHLVESPRGKLMSFREYLMMPARLLPKLKAGVNYIRCGLHAGESIMLLVSSSPQKLLTSLGIPFGCLLYLRDRKAYRRQFGDRHG